MTAGALRVGNEVHHRAPLALSREARLRRIEAENERAKVEQAEISRRIAALERGPHRPSCADLPSGCGQVVGDCVR